MQTQNASSLFATAGRVLLASLFLISGFGKLAAPGATIAYIASTGAPFPALAYAAAVFVEVGLSIALLVGFRARIVAAAMALFTVATAFLFHAHFGDQNQAINFWKNISIAGGLLQVVAFGAGAFSLDGRRVKTKTATASFA
ncbi:DoxX family protein [Frateuria defendens]|uniref:DoxX family protein n=1 Tax=Frateuria defendens TaxID=2219559 RepID=UPI00066FE26F|nr:DoxX family protein [Frateuria defendens]